MPNPSTEKLPDQLRDNLRLVFVGTAASARSASVGHFARLSARSIAATIIFMLAAVATVAIVRHGLGG